VSREWDRVDDRFDWVKEGIKFLVRGTGRNSTVPILFHDVGSFISKKMGISDEKKFFREFWVHDPDPKFNGGADGELNPLGLDSYLVAKEWFIDANQKDDEDEFPNNVKGMTHVFFRQGPSKAQIDYAGTRAQDGDFDGHLPAWQEALRMWVEEYGNMVFLGLDDKKYKLVASPEETAALAEENGITPSEQRRIQQSNLDMVNFNHFRELATVESDPDRLALHKTFFQARQAYVEGRGFDEVAADGSVKVSEAQTLLEQAMNQWVALSTKDPKVQHLFEQDQYLNEAMLIVQYWLAVHQQNGKTPPEDYPLKAVRDAHPDMHTETERTFLMETRSRRVTR
jgi:hypothetical protein